MDIRMETKPTVGVHLESDSERTSSHHSINRKRSYSAKNRHGTENRITEEYSKKKPRLMVDTSRECQPLCEALSSNESFSSGLMENDICHTNSDDLPIMNTSLWLGDYLEDIDSDEELDEIEATPPASDSPEKPQGKDDLLTMMDKVDRDITMIEQRILSLEKKQKELQKSATQTPSLDSSNESSPVASATSDYDESGSDHQMSVVETIYTDNRLKARNAYLNVSGAMKDLQTPFATPLYYQPSEAPAYWHNIERHRRFRPELLKFLKARRLDLYKKELELINHYDQLMVEWEKKMERFERKKRGKDAKSRDMFEKTFPELRSKSEQLRDQAERSNRAGMRSFGVVKSEAELDELAYELYEQEEAKGRHRLIHANIPSLILDEKERQFKFINTNGLLKDPMVLYRETKSMSLWTDGEKQLFREKFQLFPKNFEKISSFIPNKTVRDCVRYYYLAKKAGNFKSLSRRSVLKRRRHHLPKSHEYPLTSPLLFEQPKTKPHPQLTTPVTITSPTTKEPVVWSEEEIARLKNGLRIYGRAWGRVYREVGGYKTATQCKQFYDDYCTDLVLDLNSALAEHSAKKNAERAEKKMAELKNLPGVLSVSDQPHGKVDDEENSSGSETSDHMSSQEDEEQESDSETTITDSGQEEEEEEVEDDEDEETEETESEETRPMKPKLNPLKLSSGSLEDEPIQSPLDIFLSAAEALSNTVPSEVALHDHTYACPPLDIQGSSGLQLIAAAAAVVSPGLSRTTWNSSSKTPLSHTVKAPRGRPPSTQKRNTATSQKIGPSFLTPTSGASQCVLLQDVKPTLRGRSRSAPTEKPRPTVQQKNPALASSLLLKSGTKLLTTPQPVKGTASTLAYTSRSKDGSNLVSLKPSSVISGSNALDTIVNMTGANAIGDSHKQMNSTAGQPKTMSTRTKENSNNNNPVLELNLGNMALLLAASGTNQQATILLPPSSLFNNKHAVALLHSGSLDMNVDTPSSFTLAKHTPTISIDLSKTMVESNSNSIPLVTPLKPQTNRQMLTLQLGSATPVSTPKGGKQPPTVLPTISLNSVLRTTKTHNSAPVTPVATPTTDDLSNLNLLSNLVAGMSNKSTPLTTTTTTINKTPPLSLPTTVTVSSSTCLVNSVSSIAVTATTSSAPLSKLSPIANQTASEWKKQQPDMKNINKSSTTSVPPTYSSTQQSLMLYTRSLPLNSTVETSPEEEDHLEYATRGIDELTKLLGGSDNGLNEQQVQPAPPFTTAATASTCTTSKQPSLWSPDELLCNPFNSQQNTSSSKSISSTSLVTMSTSNDSGFDHPTNVLTELKSHSTA